jgi:hypothetical protein
VVTTAAAKKAAKRAVLEVVFMRSLRWGLLRVEAVKRL